MFTKCATCHKWDVCPTCGACHACLRKAGRTDIVDACVAVRAIRAAESLQSGHATRKRQSTPYAPGMGQNGTKPRASDGRRNWFKGIKDAETGTTPSKPRESGKTDERRQSFVHAPGDDRRRALWGGSHE